MASWLLPNLGVKNKLQFNCSVVLDQLNSVPYLNGVFFAKLRLLSAPRQGCYSLRNTLRDHSVEWSSVHDFHLKLNVESDFCLEPCYLKVSIRQEIRGGKSAVKLGHVTVNLSCFAERGRCEPIKRRYILQGYDHGQRLNNALLCLRFSVWHVGGCSDHIWRAPQESLENQVPFDTVRNTSCGNLELGACGSCASFSGTVNSALQSQQQQQQQQQQSLANKTLIAFNNTSSLITSSTSEEASALVPSSLIELPSIFNPSINTATTSTISHISPKTSLLPMTKLTDTNISSRVFQLNQTASTQSENSSNPLIDGASTDEEENWCDAESRSLSGTSLAFSLSDSSKDYYNVSDEKLDRANQNRDLCEEARMDAKIRAQANPEFKILPPTSLASTQCNCYQRHQRHTSLDSANIIHQNCAPTLSRFADSHFLRVAPPQLPPDSMEFHQHASHNSSSFSHFYTNSFCCTHQSNQPIVTYNSFLIADPPSSSTSTSQFNFKSPLDLPNFSVFDSSIERRRRLLSNSSSFVSSQQSQNRQSLLDSTRVDNNEVVSEILRINNISLHLD